MIDDLRPYAKMKPSGLPWLGDVPAHWDVRRIKTLLQEVDNRSKTGEERLLSLRMRQGLVDHIEAGGKPILPASLIGYKIVEPGQVVMNRMRAAAGLFGVASVRGLVSPDYAVFEPKPDAFNPYLLQAFRLPTLAAVFRAESKGLGTGESGFLRLYTDRFGPIPVPYPPLEEQRLIVRFLDWHGGQVARLVRAKKALIGLLNEQKQAIIHRAVTRGLDPNAKLKPSGISWLGDVPEGWEVKPVLACFSEKNTKNRGMVETTVLSLSYGRIIVKPPEKLRGLVPESFETYQTIDPGDIIVRSTDLQNDQKSLRVGIARDRGIITSAYMCLRTKGEMTSEFGYQILNTYDLLKIIYGYGSGLRQNLGFADIRRMPVPLPPPRQQNAIVEYLSRATKDASMAIEYIGHEIALIQEFRTRMVADVVTGKLDVRALAATLPETAGQDMAFDPAEDEDLDDLPEDADTEEAAA